MPTWEYRILSRYWTNGSWTWTHDKKDQRSPEELLNALGRDGWELVATPAWLSSLWQPGGGQPYQGPADTVVNYIFKRPG